MKIPTLPLAVARPGNNATRVARDPLDGGTVMAFCRLAGVVLVAIISLTACKTTLPELPDDDSLTSVTDPDARRLLVSGDAIAAADIYSARAANAVDIGQREDYQLIAAEILFDRAMLEAGLERLADVPEELSATSLMQRRDILVAKSLLFSGDPEAALLALPDPNTIDAPLHRARVYETRAQTYRALDDPDNELIARIELESQVNEPAIIARSHDEIWQMLMVQPLSTL